VQWRERINDYLFAQEKESAAYFVAIESESNQVVAHCTLSQIVCGPFQACYMGYGISKSYEGKGAMFQTCTIAIRHAFQTLKLHRIMANYMPHNNRSAKLLTRLGFVKEGVAKDYLKINGRWENHVLTSLTRKSIT
jgi:[ribosomal protein S5]-alanine N-acetyltransferase